MPSIQEFIVVEPPTSGEVRKKAFTALREGGLLRLTLLGEQEVPKPEPIVVELQVDLPENPRKNDMEIVGLNQLGDSIVIRMKPDTSLPATASMVTR